MTKSSEGASPKSPRYFYPPSRGHHAACMAIDFGMQFTEWRWDADRFCFAPTTANDDEPDERLYIHPDSLHLMEPQELDILYRTNGYCQTVGVHIGVPKTVAQLAAGAVIIQRNGLAFHWPESEAV